MKIKQKLVPAAKYNLKCPYSMKAEYITVHNTYNDASAMNEVKYMISNNNSTSFHVAVDDIEAVQGIPFNRNAWAAGDGNGNGNRKSIHIEICYSKSGGECYKKAEGNAVILIAQMLKERGWGVERVKQHYDWSKKNCPHRIRDEKRWDSFLNRIKAEMNKKIEADKGDNEMLKFSSNTFKNEMVTFLENAHKRGLLSSHSWINQAKEGKLSKDDAISLIVTIMNRSEESK